MTDDYYFQFDSIRNDVQQQSDRELDVPLPIYVYKTAFRGVPEQTAKLGGFIFVRKMNRKLEL